MSITVTSYTAEFDKIEARMVGGQDENTVAIQLNRGDDPQMSFVIRMPLNPYGIAVTSAIEEAINRINKEFEEQVQ